MKKSDTTISSAVAGLRALAIGAATAAENEQSLVYGVEKGRCFGVAKAGKNDCATATSACAGTAKQDQQRDAWVYVPKSTCESSHAARLPR